MKTLYTVLFCLICSSALLAQNNWSFILGLNYSTFYDEENNGWIPGGAFGFEKDWYLIDDLGLNLQIIFTIKGGILKDKAIGPYTTGPEEIYSKDITGRVGYLEFPITLSYKLYSTSSWSMRILFGYFFALPITDLSSLEKKEHLFTYDASNPDHENLVFEYYPVDVSGFGIFEESYQLNQGPVLGVGFNIQKYVIVFRYTRDLSVFGSVDEITSINKRIHTFSVMFGINI